MPRPVSVTLFILLCMVAKMLAQEDKMSQQAEFERIYDGMYRAMIAKDTVALAKMLDDSFVLVHMTGMRQSKKDYLKAIANGTLNYFTCDDTVVETDESRGVNGAVHIVGRSRVNAAVFSGGRHTWPLQLDIDFVKRGNNWIITEIKASTY